MRSHHGACQFDILRMRVGYRGRDRDVIVVSFMYEPHPVVVVYCAELIHRRNGQFIKAGMEERNRNGTEQKRNEMTTLTAPNA